MNVEEITKKNSGTFSEHAVQATSLSYTTTTSQLNFTFVHDRTQAGDRNVQEHISPPRDSLGPQRQRRRHHHHSYPHHKSTACKPEHDSVQVHSKSANFVDPPDCTEIDVYYHQDCSDYADYVRRWEEAKDMQHQTVVDAIRVERSMFFGQNKQEERTNAPCAMAHSLCPTILPREPQSSLLVFMQELAVESTILFGNLPPTKAAHLHSTLGLGLGLTAAVVNRP